MADKRAIAQFLSQHAEQWISPAEIKAAVADVPDRTLRRWLGELVHQGVIERSGSRKGTRYRWKPTAKGGTATADRGATRDITKSP
jgi:DNA-binding HxlR family transcriptional regulator